MALQFEVESLDGIEEGFQSLYTEHEGKYRLQVEGIDPADELKAALQKERNETKAERAKRIALEESQRKFEEQTAAEKGEYKTLWEKEQEAKRELQEKLSSFQKATIDKDKNLMVVEAIGALTKDESKADALKGIINNFVKVDESGTVSYSRDGVEIKKTDLVEHIKERYPFLVDGSKASGGDSKGNSNAGSGASVINRQEFDALNPIQKAKFLKDGGKLVD